MHIYWTYQEIIRMLTNIKIINLPSFFSFSGKSSRKTHSRLYRFVNRQANYLKHAANSSKFVDYTSITCRFSIPIRLPDVIYTNMIIFNRDNNDSITTSTIKNISLKQILQLIEYNRKFYEEPMLPIYMSNISSSTTVNYTTIKDDLVMIKSTLDNNDDEPNNLNVAVLDE